MRKLCILGMLLTALLCGAAERPPIKAVLLPFHETVVAARVDSMLLPYQCKIGGKFKANDVLVKLDDSRYVIELSRAVQQHAFAEETYKDKQELREKNFTSDYELKKAEFDFRMMQNNLAEARLNHSYCEVKAPFDGKLVEVMTREYEMARPGQPLFRIIADDRLLAVMNVPMSDKTLTTVGQKVTIRLSDKLSAPGTIYEVSPQADNRTGTVRVRALIDNRDGNFTAGMTGELEDGGK